jgi:hypothetical protein
MRAAPAETERQPEGPTLNLGHMIFVGRLYRRMTLRGQMHMMSKSVIILGLSLMLSVGAALADDPVTIRMYNDDADDIVVSVYDLNAQPPEAVVAGQRINGFAWISVSVSAGVLGKGHVKWIARTADSDFHRCGHQEVHGVANDALVYVSVNSSCQKITQGD